jgi:hypothetical protein
LFAVVFLIFSIKLKYIHVNCTDISRTKTEILILIKIWIYNYIIYYDENHSLKSLKKKSSKYYGF